MSDEEAILICEKRIEDCEDHVNRYESYFPGKKSTFRKELEFYNRYKELLLNVQHWINVEEEKEDGSVKFNYPEKDDTVLVYHPLSKGTDHEIQIQKGWAIHPSIETHWMPLPVPPDDSRSI